VYIKKRFIFLLKSRNLKRIPSSIVKLRLLNQVVIAFGLVFFYLSDIGLKQNKFAYAKEAKMSKKDEKIYKKGQEKRRKLTVKRKVNATNDKNTVT